MEKTKKAYAEIFKAINKHKDIIVFDIDRLKLESNNHLFGLELKNKHGLNIKPEKISTEPWQELKSDVYLELFSDENSRTISWSDNGEQPKNEWLVIFKYSTGAYIFGRDYPTDYFQKFWDELISYNPRYVDTHNCGLYFSLDNASKVFNEYDSILKRYYENNKLDRKQREIKRIEKQLKELKK